MESSTTRAHNVRRIAPPDARLIDLTKRQLHRQVERLGEAMLRRAKAYGKRPQLARELELAARNYRRQAHDAIERIQRGGLALDALREVAGTLYLTNLTFRWILEQQTDIFRKMLHMPTPKLGQQIEQARVMIDEGQAEQGLKVLLALLNENRGHYPLIMTMGFVYLRVKKNLSYAMRYFEKAAKSPAQFERGHYTALAFQFLAICDEGQKRYKNALNNLMHALEADPDDPAIHFSIARMHGRLEQADKAVEHFDIALRHHPAFYSMALIDPAFTPVRASLEKRMLSYNETFRRLAGRFEEMLDRVMVYVTRYRLDEQSPELSQRIDLLRGQIELIRGGCYTGYRSGIVAFYETQFPGILEQLELALRKRRASVHEAARKKEARSGRRVQLVVKLLAPLAMLGGGAGGWIVWQRWSAPILGRLPFDLPMPELLLPGLGALLGLLGALALARLVRTDSSEQLEQVQQMGQARGAMLHLNDNLRDFWTQQVQPHVVDLPSLAGSDPMTKTR